MLWVNRRLRMYPASMGSNENGRGFEYETVRLLIYRGFAAGPGAIADQARDQDKLDECPQDVAERIRAVAPLVADWIRSRVPPGSGMTVDRLADSSGGVADVVIRSGAKTLLAVSLKFNHDALKHPRPYSLAVSCGFPEGSSADLDHRTAMSAAVTPLIRVARSRSVQTFREVRAETREMYDRVVQACARSLESWIRSDGSCIAERMFRFIVGSGYYKVIAPKAADEPVVVQDFTSVSTPSSMTVEANRSNLELRFNNTWHVRMRLHSASSKIRLDGRQVSLKFDARREQGHVPQLEIESLHSRKA
jgi:hypothetical protein